MIIDAIYILIAGFVGLLLLTQMLRQGFHPAVAILTGFTSALVWPSVALAAAVVRLGDLDWFQA